EQHRLFGDEGRSGPSGAAAGGGAGRARRARERHQPRRRRARIGHLRLRLGRQPRRHLRSEGGGSRPVLRRPHHPQARGRAGERRRRRVCAHRARAEPHHRPAHPRRLRRGRRLPAMTAAGPATRAFAAVDLGATSGRVMIGRVTPDRVDLELVRRFPNGPVERADGLHWDIGALYENVLDGLAEAVRRAPEIESIGIDSWAVDYGLLRDGELLGEPFHYRDARTDRGVRAVHERVPFEELYTRSGLQFLPFNTLYQYRADARLTEADTALLIPDLVAFLLTGRRVAERTNASTTGLLDACTAEWDVDLADRLGIPRGILPPLIDPGTVIGALRPEVAA